MQLRYKIYKLHQKVTEKDNDIKEPTLDLVSLIQRYTSTPFEKRYKSINMYKNGSQSLRTRRAKHDLILQRPWEIKL